MKSLMLAAFIANLFGCAMTAPVKPPASDLDLPTGQTLKP